MEPFDSIGDCLCTRCCRPAHHALLVQIVQESARAQCPAQVHSPWPPGGAQPQKVPESRLRAGHTFGALSTPSDGLSADVLPVVECHVAEACLGGPESLCGDGYDGLRCGECSDGYYKISRRCTRCSSNASAIILLILLVLSGLLLVAFFKWQTMRDPRIGSSLVIVMRLLENLGILSFASARWPGSIPTFLSIASLVNLNTEVFQTECLLGRPHPTRAALMYVAGAALVLLLFLLAYSLLQLYKHCARCASSASPSLESICEQLMPGKAGPGTRLLFTPIQALMVATFHEYIKISLTVSLRSRPQAAEEFWSCVGPYCCSCICRGPPGLCEMIAVILAGSCEDHDRRLSHMVSARTILSFGWAWVTFPDDAQVHDLSWNVGGLHQTPGRLVLAQRIPGIELR